MKRLLIILISLFTLATMSSCVETQYVVDNEVPYSTVITYGVPYYIDGVISYYIYNNRYYYPYIWNNHWYVRSYSCAMPRGFIYRPTIGHRPPGHFENRHWHNNHDFRPKPSMPSRAEGSQHNPHNGGHGGGSHHFGGHHK